MPTRIRGGLAAVLASIFLALSLGAASSALADARTDYLVRALRTSDMFRVRAQAAISLGGVQTEPQVIDALVGALADREGAVRAAAASSLERHGDGRALAALQRVANDPEPAVRRAAESAVRRLNAVAATRPRTAPLPTTGGSSAGGGPARFYVAVGSPATTVRGLPPSALTDARSFIAQTARSTAGVEIAPDNERPPAAQRVLRERDLVGYYLDSSIVSIEERPNGGLRASVTVVLQSYPDRNIRSMLNGAATVMGATGETARTQAIQGALRGALRNLPQAMEAGAASAQATASPRGR